MEQQHLITTINKVDFGFPIDKVISIEKTVNSTAIPMMPEYLSGIVSIRDGILPMLDLNMILYGKKTTLSDSSRLVLIENNGLEFALLVDEAKEIVSLSSELILSLQSVDSKGTTIIDGVFHREDGLVSLINIARFLESLTEIEDIRNQLRHSNHASIGE